MPAPKRTPARKASGENIEEWQRHTSQLKLRLPPDLVEQVRARAASEGQTLSGYVERLLRQDMMIV